MGERTQIETVQTAVVDERFSLTVGGVEVRVTRFGVDEQGRAQFELAHLPSNDTNYRDVFPTDRGYVEDGSVYMVAPESVHKDASEWSFEHVGEVDSCLYHVGQHIGAERAG